MKHSIPIALDGHVTITWPVLDAIDIVREKDKLGDLLVIYRRNGFKGRDPSPETRKIARFGSTYRVGEDVLVTYNRGDLGDVVLDIEAPEGVGVGL